MIDERHLFHSDRCYKRYLYGRKFAEKINEYIDRGCLVIDEYGEPLKPGERFIFRDGEILLSDQKRFSVTYIGSVFDDEDKIYLLDDEFTMKNIKAKFQMFKIVDRKHIRKVRL